MLAFKLLLAAVAINLAISEEKKSVLMDLSSDSGEDFYLNELATLKCEFKTDPDFLGPLSGFGYKRDDSYIGCDINRRPGKKPLADANEGSFLTNEQCQAVFDDISNSRESSLTFSFKLEHGGKYSCAAWTQDLDYDSASRDITLKTAPSDIAATVKNGESYSLGEEVSFTCISNGGEPAPDWEYKKNDVKVDGNGITFTTTKADDKVRLSCKDKNHANYKGGNTLKTVLEVSIKVYFLEPLVASPQKLKVYYEGPTERLKCVVQHNLPDDMPIHYIWKKGDDVLEEATEHLTLTFTDDKHLDETYSCEAFTDGRRYFAHTEFHVHWYKDLTTTPVLETSTNGTMKAESLDGEKDNTVYIVVGVILGVLVLAGVLIAVIFLKKRRSGSMKKPETPASPKTPKGDVEAAQKNGDEDAKQLLETKEPPKAE